jgi:hypothetical protein
MSGISVTNYEFLWNPCNVKVHVLDAKVKSHFLNMTFYIKNKIFDTFMRNKVLLFVTDAENKTSAKYVLSREIQ